VEVATEGVGVFRAEVGLDAAQMARFITASRRVVALLSCP
jgi:hypothetical protein